MTTKKIPIDKPILLFDGVCNLCDNSVQFIIKRDSKSKIRFAALQSETGQFFIKKFNLSHDDMKTIILVEKNKSYTRSTAVLRMARYMDGLWSWAYGFVIVPRFIRDVIYNWIAKNRYRWFGEKESCMMPTPELRARFLS